jgi:hypothetical protein
MSACCLPACTCARARARDCMRGRACTSGCGCAGWRQPQRQAAPAHCNICRMGLRLKRADESCRLFQRHPRQHVSHLRVRFEEGHCGKSARTVSKVVKFLERRHLSIWAAAVQDELNNVKVPCTARVSGQDNVVLLKHSVGCSMGAFAPSCVLRPSRTSAARAQKLSSPPSRKCARTLP